MALVFNNSLLEALKVVDKIESEIKEFFHWNSGSVTVITVWETFKVYIRGLMITLNTSRQKVQNQIKNYLIQQIGRLNCDNKKAVDYLEWKETQN